MAVSLLSSRAIRLAWTLSLMLLLSSRCGAVEDAPISRQNSPNIVIILVDDLGYADIGPVGATAYSTPNLDRMAREGRIFTDFHAVTSLCSASRAGLLTGCYPERIGILRYLPSDSNIGIHKNETTLAELCKSRGYATAIFGKWHVGQHRQFLPLQQGFDEFFGLPYSPLQAEMVPGMSDADKDYYQKQPQLPLLENNEVVDSAVSPEELTELAKRFTEHAVRFIDRNKDRPFFLYLPHTMVHVPLAVSKEFQGKSGAGLYADCVLEVDDSVGQILDALKRNGIDQNTLVIFTSDNGPSLEYGNYGGSAGPLREGKATMWEGGYRVPCVMRWPDRIPAGTKCDEFASNLDLLPTVCRLLSAKLPTETIDGKDIWPLIAGDRGAKSPYDVFYCYQGRELRAVRDRRWKLVFPHKYHSLEKSIGGRDGLAAPFIQKTAHLALYDLKNDVGEQVDVSQDHPDVVERLKSAAEKARAALGDVLTKREGNEVRPPGQVAVE